jgi:hypothetical protein
MACKHYTKCLRTTRKSKYGYALHKMSKSAFFNYFTRNREIYRKCVRTLVFGNIFLITLTNVFRCYLATSTLSERSVLHYVCKKTLTCWHVERRSLKTFFLRKGAKTGRQSFLWQHKKWKQDITIESLKSGLDGIHFESLVTFCFYSYFLKFQNYVCLEQLKKNKMHGIQWK